MATHARTEPPWEIRDVQPHEFRGLEKAATNDGKLKFVRVGPKGYILTDWYKKEAVNIYTMPISSSDVLVNSYPRSGTTWTQELVWMVANNLDYAKSKAVLLAERYQFIEEEMFVVYGGIREKCGDLEIANSNELPREHLGESPSARFFKTHLPLSLLPPTLDTAKVVYVARDPRDVTVSFYHLSRLIYHFTEDFKSFWNCCINELELYQPYFEHVKEAWQKRHHPNLLFLFYEDMLEDLPAVVRRVADFFGKQFTEEQVKGLCSHLSFQNFKENKSLNLHLLSHEVGKKGEETFIRKGKAGGWREHFDEEMTQQAARWIQDNLRGSDLRYPHMDQQTQ